jgi:hypothetical protein
MVVAHPPAMRTDLQNKKIIGSHRFQESFPIALAENRLAQVKVEFFEQGGLKQELANRRCLAGEDLPVEIDAQVHTGGAGGAHAAGPQGGSGRVGRLAGHLVGGEDQPGDPAFGLTDQFLGYFTGYFKAVILLEQEADLFRAESQFLKVKPADLLAGDHHGNIGQCGEPARSQDHVAVLARLGNKAAE